ncbi:NAD(P)H-hydrate dehydratase [Natronomonas sp. EA1]|uniref:NAD(P)H-hydrate dehydratase n=1 Tax=Natronomonas sp. EA1 TaxID=3421655 RepID=UPI003EBCCFEE
MITSDEMAVVDRNAAALGVPTKQLMESSGNAIARVARELVPEGAEIALVCGRGNNGGDAFVAARFLTGYDVTVHLLGRPETISTDIARENWEALEQAELATEVVRDSRDLELGTPDLVVDAMLGTGITGELREPEASAAAAINESDATVLAVDVPSGVDADTGDGDGVEADHVVTFHDEKPGLSKLDATVHVADIGIPAAAETFVERGDLLRLGRDPRSHKGDHGEVLVVGGGPYTGAPALAAQAALRAGADLVRVACPASIAREVQGYDENLILRPFEGERLTPDAVPHIRTLAADHDVTLIGPGLGDDEATLDAVREFLFAFDGTGVVDADALQVVPDVETEATLLCTPHQGELRRMGGPASDGWRERRELVEAFASEIGHTLLVKGAYDIISDGDRTRVSKTGNPGMTVGGTGDVLAGAASALACPLSPVNAGGVAAYANGRAGDAVVARQGYGLTATDLVSELPKALRFEE